MLCLLDHAPEFANTLRFHDAVDDINNSLWWCISVILSPGIDRSLIWFHAAINVKVQMPGRNQFFQMLSQRQTILSPVAPLPVKRTTIPRIVALLSIAQLSRKPDILLVSDFTKYAIDWNLEDRGYASPCLHSPVCVLNVITGVVIPVIPTSSTPVFTI